MWRIYFYNFDYSKFASSYDEAKQVAERSGFQYTISYIDKAN